MVAEQPEPGPPCTTSAGLPSGLPHVSQYTRLPSPTSSIPCSYGSIGGYHCAKSFPPGRADRPPRDLVDGPLRDLVDGPLRDDVRTVGVQSQSGLVVDEYRGGTGGGPDGRPAAGPVDHGQTLGGGGVDQTVPGVGDQRDRLGAVGSVRHAPQLLAGL